MASISVDAPSAFVGNMHMSHCLSCSGHIVVDGLSTLIFFLLSIVIRQVITMLNIDEGYSLHSSQAACILTVGSIVMNIVGATGIRLSCVA